MPALRDEDVAAVIVNTFLYGQNKELFAKKVNSFDLNALKTYIGLVTSFEKQKCETPNELLQLIVPDNLFQNLNEAKKLLQNENQLSKYLVDMFELLLVTNKCIDGETFYDCFLTHLRIALKQEQAEVISVYLQILHRLGGKSETEIPVEILKTIVEAIHGSISDNSKLLNEALLVIESNLQKRHQTHIQTPASEQLLNFMWHSLCSRGAPKHQCNVCYTIVAQLIKVYLKECQLNESFQEEFLSSELWHFIRAAIESKEMLRRKQAIYILQNILESNEKAVMNVNRCSEESDGDLGQIWKQYFAILESLLEIQCNLIISCLDQYLEEIVKYLPSFWYSIIFALVLKHHNNIVIHYGIDFILSHRIPFQHDNDLIDGLYLALNNTYLHSEAKISEQNLAKYFQDSDMNHTLNIMMLISWHAVPLWTMVKSLDVYVQLNQGMGFQTVLLLEFLKRSVRVIKNMPEVGDMVVSILRNIGINNLTLEQMLGLYEVIGRSEILDGYHKPLDMQKFGTFIQLNQLSIETKITYFEHAIPDVKEQSKFLVEFFEKNRTRITYFPHYEFLLLNTLCTEKQLYVALLETTPRIYSLMRPQGAYTLDGLEFAASLLKFVVNKFINDSSDAVTFDSVNKILHNFYEVIRKKLYTDYENSVKLQQIKEQLTMISIKMIKCTELYPHKMAVLGILSDAMKLDVETIDLVRKFFDVISIFNLTQLMNLNLFVQSRFDPEDEDDIKLVQGLYDCFIEICDEFKQTHQAMVISRLVFR